MKVFSPTLESRGFSLYRICTINELVSSIGLLQDGFGWSSDYSRKLVDFISDTHVGMSLGYALHRKDRLVGAILTLHQGNFPSENSADVPILNLSSWYVEPEFRGGPVVAMAEAFMSDLKDSIITDYTANPAASKILSCFGMCSPGFKRLELFVWNIRLWSPQNLRAFLFSRLENSSKHCETGFIPRSLVPTLSLRSISSEVDRLYFSKGFVRYTRKMLCFRISIRVLHVHWASSIPQLREKWCVLALLALFKYGALGVLCDIKAQESDFLKDDQSWMYSRASNSPFLVSCDYYEQTGSIPSPVASELTISEHL